MLEENPRPPKLTLPAMPAVNATLRRECQEALNLISLFDSCEGRFLSHYFKTRENSAPIICDALSEHGVISVRNDRWGNYLVELSETKAQEATMSRDRVPEAQVERFMESYREWMTEVNGPPISGEGKESVWLIRLREQG